MRSVIFDEDDEDDDVSDDSEDGEDCGAGFY